MEIKRFKGILDRKEAALLVIDIQGKIIKVIDEYQRVIDNSLKLIRGCRILGIPVYHTEQYPSGLGETVTEIKNEFDSEAIQKMTFSCSGAGTLFGDLINSGIRQVILCGIESHVCVQQTALDLLANGFEVTITADAVSSRKKIDYEIAVDRMRDRGVDISTTEAVLFELMERCGTDEFKMISKLIK